MVITIEKKLCKRNQCCMGLFIEHLNSTKSEMKDKIQLQLQYRIDDQDLVHQFMLGKLSY